MGVPAGDLVEDGIWTRGPSRRRRMNVRDWTLGLCPASGLLSSSCRSWGHQPSGAGRRRRR